MRSDNMPRPFAPEYEAQDVLVRLRSFPSTPAEPDLAKEAADEIERLREDVAQLRDLLADLELTREGLRASHAELRELTAKIEAAPVGKAISYSRPPMRAITGISVEGGADVWGLAGKRVRLVVEEDDA